MFERYRDFIRHLQIKGIWLSKSIVELHVLPGEAIRHKGNQIHQEDLDASFENLETGRTIVKAGTQIKMINEKGDELVRIQVEFKLEYTADIPFDEDLMELFAPTLLPSHVLPYMREYFQNTFVRMNLPPATMPIWRSPILGDGKHREKKETGSTPEAKQTRTGARRPVHKKTRPKATN